MGTSAIRGMSRRFPDTGSVRLWFRKQQRAASAADYPSARVEGFELGMYVSYGDCGDAWVSAPDGSIATLIWETGEPAYVKVSIVPSFDRWGTFAVQLPLPLTTDQEAAAYLGALLPDLRPRWEAWKAGG
jgi:hypothetical protein